MTRAYEEVEQEQNEQKDFFNNSELHNEKEMIELYHTIDALLPDVQGKMIQFIGSRSGEGVTTIIRSFAMVLAVKLKKSVLLLDADLRPPVSETSAQNAQEHDLQMLVENGTSLEKILNRRKDADLLVNSGYIRAPSLFVLFNSSHVNDFCEKLRQRFDFILIDSPSVNASPDGLTIARYLDGTILVVEAENTRWRVANHIKNRIIKAGGNILGVVFNKRHFYIPATIYRFLSERGF